MKLAANLDIFFTDAPLEDRVARIADLGFTAADMFGLEGKDLGKLAKACDKHSVTITMIVGTDLKKALNDRSLHGEIEQRVRRAAEAARELRATNVVVLSGDRLPRVAASEQNRAIIDGLRRLVPIADACGITIVLEMLNSLYDHPGYYLDDTELMVSLVRAVNHPRIKGLYDMYHAGIMRGDLTQDIRAGLDAIGHFHLAGIPGRSEPAGGEQNYPAICRSIDAAGYTGHIALEYWPKKDPAVSLRETKAWLET